MSKVKPTIAESAEDLAEALGLGVSNAHEWEAQYSLLLRLRRIVQERGLTHAEVAKLGGSSRTRVTAILNGNLSSVSTDLLIRLLRGLGYRVRFTLSRMDLAA